MEITWNDELGHRRRAAWALVVHAGRVMAFNGATIPEVVAVLGTDYHRNGVWSSTTYRLAVVDGARFISGLDGWETGTFTEGLRSSIHADAPIDRWADMANALGVTITEVQRFLREWRPRAAERLDQVEADLEAVDDASEGGVSEIAISFGRPTNRMMREGFWEWPVRVVDASEAEVDRLVAPDYRPASGDRVRVIACERERGSHGGYVSLRVAAPEGCRLEHEPEPQVLTTENASPASFGATLAERIRTR